jgi:DNA (cytosine-5)-methyltransferase 1
MLDGQVFELVMPAHPTKDLESLSLPTPTTQDNSGTCRDHGGDLLHELICGCPRADRKNLELLRTPVASEAEGGAVAPDVAKANGQTLRLSGQMIDMVAPDQLPKLPTPTVSDQYTANLASTQQKEGSMHSVTLAQVFHKPDLFPTPTTRDYKDGSEPHERDGKVQTDTVARAVFNSGEVLLGTPRATAANSSSKQVELGAPKARLESQVHTNWGKFEPAIRRWEAIIGRQAPEPTKPDGKERNHRLSSKFTEWMMGLPDGWITDIGLKRNDELKACGNGVVPQQAELALSLLGIKEILER